MATRPSVSESETMNDADVNSRQTSTYNLRGKRGFESRWKTVALAWFGSFAIFRAVASSNGSTANASGSASAKANAASKASALRRRD